MPPFTYQSFEEIEAKEWASNTVKTILTDVRPVSFEAVDYNGKGHLRRSLSFLESSLSPEKVNENAKWSRRSQSTILPSTHSNDKQHNTSSLHQPTFPCRLRNNWYSTPSLKSTLNVLFNSRNKSNREKEGYTLWKNKIAEYSIHPPWSKAKPSTKNSIQLSKFIMTELLTTEETYLAHLMTIKNFYMDPLINAATKKSSLVNMKNIEIIFAYIPELIMLSDALGKQLHNAISSDCLEDETKRNQVFIGKLFCEFEPYFEIYIAYAVNFSKSRKYLTKASSNITYHQLIQDTMRKKDANRMLLSDYMIAPIQRITRYCLLLTDLLKHTHKSHQDYFYLDKALKSLSALAFAMNTVQ